MEFGLGLHIQDGGGVATPGTLPEPVLFPFSAGSRHLRQDAVNEHFAHMELSGRMM